MKTINDQTRLQFVSYLRHTLIPDFHAAEMTSTATDFETSLQFIADDVEILYDARKALLAASAHTPAGSNAAALVAASLKEIGEALDTMKTTPYTRPLAERITQGETYHWQGSKGAPDKLIYFGVKLGPIVLYMGGSSPKPADAELIAEAFNVTHETGRTPRQLADERVELIAVLSQFYEVNTRFGIGGLGMEQYQAVNKKSGELLARLTS